MLHDVKAVLFDAGNTLIECNPSMDAVMVSALAADGIELTAHQRQQALPLMWKYYNHYQRTRGLKTSVDESWEFWWLVYHDISAELGLPEAKRCAQRLLHAFTVPEAWRPYGDIIPTLDALKGAGIRMGIISNWTTGLHGILDGLGLRPYFEFVVTSAEAGYEKPDRTIYEFAFDGRRMDPADCLYVGDSVDNDMDSSLSFGMKFALIDRQNRYSHLPCNRLTDMRGLITAAEKVG